MSILYYLLSIYSEVENNRYKLFRVYKVIHVFMELRLMHACNLIPVDCFSILPLSILSLQLTIFYFSQNLSLKFDSASTIEVHVYSPPSNNTGISFLKFHFQNDSLTISLLPYCVVDLGVTEFSGILGIVFARFITASLNQTG